MDDRCTCGAIPVDGAMFCHKCGRPLRDLPEPEPEPEPPPPADSLTLPPPPPEPVRAEPPLMGFGNQAAVRTAVLVAVLSSAISIVPIPVVPVLFWRLLVLVAAGFLAVHLYQRRTGQWLNVRAGVRLGWMTGFFSYVIATVLSAVAMAMIAASPGGLNQFWRTQIGPYSENPDSQEALRLLESTEGLALLIALTFAVAFVIFTLLPMIGAALGAKVLERE